MLNFDAGKFVRISARTIPKDPLYDLNGILVGDVLSEDVLESVGEMVSFLFVEIGDDVGPAIDIRYDIFKTDASIG